MSYKGKRLHLNRERGMIGGVCAGLADYFGIEPFIVRVLFIVATITWAPTLLVYAVLYFTLNDKPYKWRDMKEQLSNNRVAKHLKEVDYRKRLHKNRRDAKISGVCAGIADYLEINPFFVRVALVLSLFLGPFGIFAYIVAAILMDEDPDCVAGRRGRRRKRTSKRRADYGRYANGWTDPMERGADEQEAPPVDAKNIQTCRDKFARLEKKLQRLEAATTSKRFRLHSEFKRMSP